MIPKPLYDNAFGHHLEWRRYPLSRAFLFRRPAIPQGQRSKMLPHFRNNKKREGEVVYLVYPTKNLRTPAWIDNMPISQ